MFHTLYNLATMFLLLPFVKYLARLMERIVPKQAKAADETYARRLLYLGSSLTGTPSMEIINARREIIRLGKIVNEQYRLSAGAFFGSNGNVFEEKRRNRDLIDYLKRNIRRKLAKLSRMGLKRQDAIQIDALDGVLRDIDRIDDRARKITRNKNKMNENGFAFSAITMDELKMLSDVVDGILAESLGVYENGDKAGLPKIKSQVKMAKGLKAACVESRIERLADRDFDAAKNEMFYDLLNCFVKSAERARKIAFSIATDKYDGDE
jgi:phosphate:Na+ symporter